MITATYHYTLSDFRGGYTAHSVKVEIIGESQKSYQIRYLEPGTFGQYVDTVKWVRKRNVKNITGAAVNIRTARHPEETRLPYKD